MWPFKRKSSSPPQLPIDGGWSTSQGEYEGKPLLVRRNDGYAPFAPIGGYEHQVGIAIPFNNPQPSGMPSGEENFALNPIEDIFESTLQTNAESLLVAVVTTGGMRELVFYTRSPDDAQRRFEEAKSQIQSHKPQLMIQPDADWQVYRGFDS